MMIKTETAEKVNRDCPMCDKVHEVEKHKERAAMKIKGETVEYAAEYYACPKNGIEGENKWTPAGMLDENLLRARDAYRINHNLLTSEEIMGIRKKYGISQKELSNILGWGNITVSRYETTHIQDETYDGLMRMVTKNPAFALEGLIKHRNVFSEERFEEIKSKIKAMIKAEGNAELKRQEIRNRYIDYDTESEANGYRILDIDKVGDVIAYFANYVKNLYKVKLMKLLWYNDVLFYDRHGKSMTGLVYEHKPLGALPIAHGEIIYLPTVKVAEEENEYGTSYNIVALSNPHNPVFSLVEQETLNKVASRFKDISGKDISEYMHGEAAYKNTAEGEIIMYSQAHGITI